MISALNLQEFLFEKNVGRTDLLNFIPTIEPSYRVAIYRNHSFELVENTIKPYLEYAGLGVDFIYSSYDDSLSFLELDTSAHLVILWLDLSLYEIPDLAGFIEARVRYLREIFDGNILLVTTGNELSINTGGLQVVQYLLEPLQAQLGDGFYDLRLEQFSGTKLSGKASLEISRNLGLNYLPVLLEPSLKSVVVDLDNTLYQGVLGEDGIRGLTLTEGHRRLQARLKELSEQGYFLCIASKNNESDVLALFEQRKDFPLEVDDFVQIYATWESKAKSIASITESLNIAADSIVFIDDNMGELISVLEDHPEIKLIWAKDDALVSYDVLSNYPGLLTLENKKEDALRKNDALANQKRSEMRSALNHRDYIKELSMELSFEFDNEAHVARVSELSNKTNQFIFSYQRYTPQQIKNLMVSNDSIVVSISLADRLSESGIIGVVVLTRHNNYALLEECFVSCRALGRGVDQAIVLGAVTLAMERLVLDRLKIKFLKGERNIPAEKFAKDYFVSNFTSDDVFEYQIPTDIIAVTIK